jgi:hypothetical protein
MLLLTFREPLPSGLLRPFQRGAQVEVKVGGDLLSLLTEDLCLTEEGIAKIQTIFWQSKPVDDIAGCVVRDGGVLALSAALPGLVGAVLRRDGFWSAMRDSITHQDEGAVQTTSRGVITIKLFNFMLSEVGPLLFKRGIRLDVAGLASLLNDPSVRQKIEEVRLANQEVAVDTLGGMLAGEQMILLCVNSLERADTE